MNRTGEALCAALRDRDAPVPGFDLASLAPADWHDVAALAIRQRVGPLLFARAGLPMPDDVREVLRTRARQSAGRALMQQAAFRELAEAVAPAGITLVALKGLHLSTTVYPSPGLRESNDIDVLVQPGEVAATAAAAVRLGYRPLSEIPMDVALKAMHHVPRFMRGQAGLEIHWRLAPPSSPPRVEPDELRTVTVPFSLAPGARALTPEALLVHICAHAASHFFEQGIRPLCDVRAIVSAAGVNLSWPEVAALAQRWGCERSTALVLAMTQEVLGVTVPAGMQTAHEVHPPRAVCAMAVTHALSNIYATTPGAGTLLAAPGLGGKLAHLRDRIWLADDERATLYPDAGTSALARSALTARRTAQLLGRHSLSLLRLAAHRQSPARAALDRRNALMAWLQHR